MSTSSAHPSQTSLSAPGSHASDVATAGPSLEQLVAYLLASKRSLSSIHAVWRANEIVTAARAALEQSLAIEARTGFLHRGISHQVEILRRVRDDMEDIYKDGQKDFKVGSSGRQR